MKLHRLAWALGMLGLPLSHYWLAAKIEPFYSSIYCFLWWSYIFVVDFAVYKLRGTSLLHDRPKEFLFLSIWSVPIWLLFEAVNLRIQNWYYVMAPWSLSAGMFFLVLAFGTVLPGVFETMELVVGLIEKLTQSAKITGPQFTVSLWNVRIQWAVGVVMLGLLLVFPRACFCLAWGFAFFLADPICYWARRKDPNQTGRSLLGQLASGDYTRLVALLVSGFIMWWPTRFQAWARETSYLLHDVTFIFFAVAVVGHIYLGTAAEPGTFRSMTRGTVTKPWARLHHPRWYREVTRGESGPK
jgi:hypothetical protein